MTAFLPVTESRIREIQSRAADRAAKRAETTAKLAERQAAEERTTISPRDLERQAALKAAADFWTNLHEQERIREYNRQGLKDVAAMKVLKEEWDKPETTPIRRGQIVRDYGELYRRYRPQTTNEMLLAYWNSEKCKAALARIYGTGK